MPRADKDGIGVQGLPGWSAAAEGNRVVGMQSGFSTPQTLLKVLYNRPYFLSDGLRQPLPELHLLDSSLPLSKLLVLLIIRHLTVTWETSRIPRSAHADNRSLKGLWILWDKCMFWELPFPSMASLVSSITGKPRFPGLGFAAAEK